MSEINHSTAITYLVPERKVVFAIFRTVMEVSADEKLPIGCIFDRLFACNLKGKMISFS